MFDESWSEDATKRVETEIALGFDMRSRPAVANTIECALNHALARKWLSRRSVARLTEEAARVLNLDIATAVAIHYTARVIKAKERSTKLDHAIEAFGTKVQEVRSAASSTIASLSESAGELNVLADTASTQSRTAAAAANDAAANVGTMAVAVNQLSTSILNIHEQATRSAEIAHRTAPQRERTNITIKSLAEAVGKVSSVADLISKIAGQTNLLALNATIEAARAGEAGLGFAVVAAEVKSLAARTAKATADIGRQIAVIEDAMHRSVEEINSGSEIGSDTVTGVTEIVEAVAKAVNDQAIGTQRIAQAASHAAANAATVTEGLRAIEETVRRTQETARTGLASTERMKTGAAHVGKAMDELFATAKGAGIKHLHPLGKQRDQSAR